MLWLLGACLLALLLIVVERLWVAPEDLLTAEDFVALPGSRIRLVARLERYIIRFYDPPLRGKPIEFFEGEKSLGTALTDANGFATLDFDVGPVGRRRLRVQTPRAQESIIVDILPPDAPILVLDIDHTITDISTTRFAFTANRDIHELPDAVAVIKRLAKRFSIVYLTARDHSFLGKTRGWLHMHDLPDGPIYLRRRRFWSQSSLDHKLERLAELKRHHRPVAGVGDLPSDAKAYLANGMTAYLMDTHALVQDVEGAIRVRSWTELEARLTPTSATSAS